MYSLAMVQVAAARDICLPAAGGLGRVGGAALAPPTPRPRLGLELLEDGHLGPEPAPRLAARQRADSKKAPRRPGGTGAVQAG